MHVRATRGALQCIPGPSHHHRPFRELCARAIEEDLFPFVFPNVPASSKVGKPQGERLGYGKGGWRIFTQETVTVSLSCFPAVGISVFDAELLPWNMFSQFLFSRIHCGSTECGPRRERPLV